MEQPVIEAQVRTEIGSPASRRLRQTEWVPAVVYGRGIDPQPIQVSAKRLREIMHGGTTGHALVDLQIIDNDNKSSVTAIIKEVQWNPLTRKANNVDFMRVSLTEKLSTSVHVVLRGESPGVKHGGILEHLVREIEIECLPTEVPDEIVVDISALEIHGTLHVRDLVLPSGVNLLSSPEEVVVVVAPPVIVAVATPVEGEVAAETAEPELIKQKRETDED